MSECKIQAGQTTTVHLKCRKGDEEQAVAAGDSPLRWTPSDEALKATPSDDGLSCEITPVKVGHHTLGVKGVVKVGGHDAGVDTTINLEVTAPPTAAFSLEAEEPKEVKVDGNGKAPKKTKKDEESTKKTAAAEK